MADLLNENRINLGTAASVLEVIASGEPSSAYRIVMSRELWQISDPEKVQALCAAVMSRNPALVELYRGGRTKVLNALLGDVARATNKRANMALVSKQLQLMLKQNK